MPSKKGQKYFNTKTSIVLSKYTPEQIQELLNSGKSKITIAKTLGINIKAFNAYMHKYNLTYKTPCQIKYGKQYKSKKREKEIVAPPPSFKTREDALEHFRQEFAKRKQKRILQELKDSYN